ncbi:MAG: ferrous iron transport protein B [Gemmatimonadetes bacterium]|nr:ferrous iron transport protein B [Gemmatimonadota bacterium]NIQ57218.1 ferrous iron transport protein B [Gemmatimonadota bacterium]NIU77389.1 ferrous iron transport protein B [Gammaproteobacteria bacterium]NIX46631.1 ferrous iron transport protein B [Gemmatimonadota bacterium]NIY10972.1 ferrous iron transport protein B [Gemmatimonadota bacterium]
MEAVSAPAPALSGAEVGESAPLVALVGPPNSGKTTLFNQLTGLRQKVANYPGVTVEKHVGRARLADDREVDLVDLPGVNGFSARTLDERVTRDVLEGRVEGLRSPDAVVVIVDSTRLESQLMLVEPILELELPTLLVLNMADELESRGGRIRDGELAASLGVEVARTNARTGEGLERVRWFLGEAAERGAGPVREAATVTNVPGRTELPVVDAFRERRERVRTAVGSADYRTPDPSSWSERLDRVLLHRVGGPLVFLAVVVLVFQAIFTWATPFMDGVEWLIATSGEWLAPRLPDGWVRSLVIDGVWAGVGSVIIFLPQILILFLFLGILEDSGYMARAAVIADRLMYRVGLQGRAFLPLLSGYACAVPAILAARTVEDERDRLATIFVTPFMTCSARLPVYALLIAAFIPERPLLGPLMGTRAATLLGLYALGAVVAVATAFLLKRTLLRGKSTSFVMELPPYRVPTLRSLGIRLWDRSRIFLRRAGRIIFTVAVVLWVLTQFPRTPEGPPPIEESALGRIGHVIEPAIEPLGYDWRIGVGLVSSLAAREVIVGTLGTIYGVEDASEDSLTLQENLQRQLDLGAAVGLLIFFAFALQCMSTVAVMRRETAGWKWPAIQWSYMLVLAFAGAWLANWLL